MPHISLLSLCWFVESSLNNLIVSIAYCLLRECSFLLYRPALIPCIKPSSQIPKNASLDTLSSVPSYLFQIVLMLQCTTLPRGSEPYFPRYIAQHLMLILSIYPCSLTSVVNVLLMCCYVPVLEQFLFTQMPLLTSSMKSHFQTQILSISCPPILLLRHPSGLNHNIHRCRIGIFEVFLLASFLVSLLLSSF